MEHEKEWWFGDSSLPVSVTKVSQIGFDKIASRISG